MSRYDGGTTTTTVPAASNKISAVGGTSYSYDSAGNITADGTNTYVWNAAGQMKEVKVGGLTVGDYVYNASNQRTAKLASGSTQQFVYGKGGLLYGEYDNTGALVREYIYLNGSPLAQVDAGSPEVLTYLHTDHLGTPRFGTNTAGTQVWSWYSDAFGNGTPSGSVTVNLRMPGQYYDSQSGLFYNWNRYYNPAIGRYISSDPIGLGGGLNTFNYVEASPVMYSDPEGKWPETIFGNPMFPEYKKLAEENLHILLKQLAPTLTDSEAKSLAAAIIEELSSFDVDVALALKDVTDVSQLTDKQKQAIKKFLKRLPEENKEAAEKLEEGCGIE